MSMPKGLPLRAFAIFLLAAVVGVAGGLLGSGFQAGLDRIQELLTGRASELDPATGLPHRESLPDAVRRHLNWWQTLLVPAGGGLVAGLLLLLLRGKKPPFGLADLVVLVQLRKGVLRLRDNIVQLLSSAATIGSGGSIGREGANSQLAAVAATLVARWSRLSSRPRAVLIGCGIAAGMATSYNAPIASALFVMEVVLGNFAMDVFAPIVVASVLAVIMREGLLGAGRIYGAAAEGVTKLPPSLVLAAIALGMLCGLGGILFRGALQLGRRLFLSLRLPIPLTMMLGGLVVGAIGIFMPEAWGNGIDVIERVAQGSTTLGVVLTLFLWKQVATVASVGSGGLGGIFTPNLVIGAAFGAVFAHCLDLLTPLTASDRTTFVFVGMAGLTAATMHAPVTAVVLVIELTGRYELTLPVLLCCIVASIVASLLDEDSYYTAAIKQKGESLPSSLEDMAISTTYVRDVQRSDTLTVADTARFADVMQLLGSNRGDTLYVQDTAGSLVGRIELQDVKNFLNDPTLTSVVIAADLTRSVVTVQPDQSIAAVMPMFDDPELQEVAVVDAGSPPKLLGRVRHQDVLLALGDQMLTPQRRTHRVAFGADQLALPPGHELRTIAVPDTWVGLAIDALPAQAISGLVVVMVQRPGKDGEQLLAATPDLVLQADWKVVLLGPRERLQQIRQTAMASDDD